MSDDLQRRYDILHAQALRLADQRNSLERILREAMGTLATEIKEDDKTENIAKSVLQDLVKGMTKQLKEYHLQRRGINVTRSD